MVAPVALVGAGEFLPQMAEIDRALLAATGSPRPRVAILPTASAPDGEDVFASWVDLGVTHFSALGAEVEPVLVRTVDDGADAAACQAVGEADLVYLSGGHPGHLSRVLRESPLGDAVRAAAARGAVIAGCSAGAMAIAARTMAPRRLARLPVPVLWPLRWVDGLDLVPGVTVIPHYNTFPETLSAFVVLQAPRRLIVLGIDDDTAAIGRNGVWQVHGAGRVTVWRGRHRERFRSGDAFRL
jgi:cyanophycinase-like exopeptidase